MECDTVIYGKRTDVLGEFSATVFRDYYCDSNVETLVPGYPLSLAGGLHCL
jgi:hypothetical protein